METFKGFPEGKISFTSLPGPFFTELLPRIDHLGEMKVILYTLWRLDHMEGEIRYLQRPDYAGDERFLQGLHPDPVEAQKELDTALERAVQRGVLLRASLLTLPDQPVFYFLNSPRGRAVVQAIGRGQWRPNNAPQAHLGLDLEPPNIFRLYEEHIGPLTPMIAETLQEAEQTYPPVWIEQALRIAVENNKRSWRYVQAILERWQREGRHEREDRRDTEEARRRYADWNDSSR